MHNGTMFLPDPSMLVMRIIPHSQNQKLLHHEAINLQQQDQYRSRHPPQTIFVHESGIKSTRLR